MPDYTVRAITDLEYVKVRRNQYIAAHRATLMERQPRSPLQSGQIPPEDPFTVEWKRAHQPQTEENTPFLKLHQRNYSSGNINDLRTRPDLALSPLVKSSAVIENQPQRTVIYPESQGKSEDAEKPSKRTSQNPEGERLLSVETSPREPGSPRH